MYSPANDRKMVRVAARIGLRTSQSNIRCDKKACRTASHRGGFLSTRILSVVLDSSGRSRWISLSVINLAHSVPPLDTGIMALILPTISISLKAPVDVVIWVPLVSLLVEAAFMPTFGNYSDRNGRK